MTKHKLNDILQGFGSLQDLARLQSAAMALQELLAGHQPKLQSNRLKSGLRAIFKSQASPTSGVGQVVVELFRKSLPGDFPITLDDSLLGLILPPKPQFAFRPFPLKPRTETMARYVMASRRAGKYQETQKRAARASMEAAFSANFEGNVNVVGDIAPADDTARRMMVFEATPAEVAAKRSALPADVILEPEILHYPTPAYLLGFALQAQGQRTVSPGTGQQIRLTIRRDDGGAVSALKGAKVIMFFRSSSPTLQAQAEQITDGNGRVSFEYSAAFVPGAAVVIPAGDYWSMVKRGPVAGDIVVCPALPKNGPVGWWHEAVGLRAYTADLGQGIRIGVADTGCSVHPALSHVNNEGSFFNEQHDPAGGGDVDAHGSHVCGIIGARPAAGGYMGAAPGAELFSARVFPPGGGANQADIVAAIEHLSKVNQVDLINLSLGSPSASEIEQDAIQDALERGTLCICAAANSGGPVEYPAAFPESVAVSALGHIGWGADGSLAAGRTPAGPDRFGLENLYLANFSCFGAEIAAAAPGVGIISTVPPFADSTRPYGVMDGTSMASPLACGVLAARLSKDAAYRALPRDLTRAIMARQALQSICRDVGLAAIYQGRGIPTT